MEHQMRRADREMCNADITELLQAAEYGILATVNEDGTPYGLPISYAFDRDQNRIYMHCSSSIGQNLSNIAHQSAATFTVVGQTELLPSQFSTRYASAIVYGNVRTAQSDEEKRQGLEAILRRLAPSNYDAGMTYITKAGKRVEVLIFEIDHMTGKHRV